MKPFLVVLICSFALLNTVQAQQKFFLAEDGSTTDSAKAKFYIARTKVSDTA